MILVDFTNKAKSKNVRMRRNGMVKTDCCPNTRMFQTQGIVYDTRMEQTQVVGGFQLR